MIPVESYLQVVSQRLGAEGFRLAPGAQFNLPQVSMVAVREKWEWARIGIEAIVAYVHVLNPPTAQTMQAFSSSVASHADYVKTQGVMEIFTSMSVYTVGLAPNGLSPEVPAWLEQYAPTHWGKIEFPVVIDLQQHMMLYRRSSPVWGGAMYAGRREFSDRLFSPR